MSSTIARTARSITARTARSLLTPAPSTSAPFERGAALANRLHGRNVVLDQQRRFASSSPRARVDANKGPVGWTSLALVSLTGATCLYFYDRERQRRVDGVRAAKTQSNGFQTNVAGGKASVGGAFRLTDSRTGKAFTDKDLLGKWAML